MVAELAQRRALMVEAMGKPFARMATIRRAAHKRMGVTQSSPKDARAQAASANFRKSRSA